MAIYVTGDIHGNPVRLGVNSFYEQKEFDKDNKDENVVIILGDFGLVWNKDGENKSLKKHNNKVDFLITHSPSTSELILMGGKGLYESDILTDYLEKVKTECDYKKHLFGHMHVNRAINEKDICLYEQIIKIK